MNTGIKWPVHEVWPASPRVLVAQYWRSPIGTENHLCPRVLSTNDTLSQLSVLFTAFAKRVLRHINKRPPERALFTEQSRRLLGGSRLAPADKPPAQESNQSTNDSYRGHRDPRDRPAAEAALVGRGVRGVDGRLLCDVAGDSAGGGWRCTAYAVGDASDVSTVLRAVHRLRTRQIVSGEARSTNA